MSTNILDAMQQTYSLFNALGNIVGNNSIISGCIAQGNQITDGVVYVNGELLEFMGGLKQTMVIIKEDVEQKIFEDGSEKNVIARRYVTFGTGQNAIEWEKFQRAKTTLELSQMLPVGIITMWSGTSVPKGWQLCNGQLGTPDLRGKFIVGLNPEDQDYKAVGKTGGAKEVAITVDEMPMHDHTGWTYEAGSHTHKTSTAIWAERGNMFKSGTNASWSYVDSEPAGAHTHELHINKAGNGKAHENRPPFYTLAYIMYLGINLINNEL